ncbi:MAG: hypothetical protein GTN80_01595 [Nitrososphaeria archaeon]|nr:hypothetical protein [Nitrososphaeria archaeon]NIN51567.1 hypothetical protein [Nitrososphaeria archaeon]NIQ32333.1 hypothetical protein [Nitrososphaeria archaeon]
MIVVDIHEPSYIPERLTDMGIDVEVKAISPGDYVVGDVGIERKSLHDFYQSIVKKRLFRQLERLREAYTSPFLLLEGDLIEVSSFSNPAIFWGAFLSVTLDVGVPLIFTTNQEQTTSLLQVLDKRLSKKRVRMKEVARYRPPHLSDEELQRYIVKGLPNIGEKSAERLLEAFGTVRNVFNANKNQLIAVPNIGRKKSSEVTRILTLRYRGQTSLR